jgi:hypothetical protein
MLLLAALPIETTMKNPASRPTILIREGSRVRQRNRRRSIDRFPSARIVAGLEIEPWLVPVDNISVGGLRLVVNRRVLPGKILSLRLFNTDRRFQCQVPFRVIHVLETSESEFAIGGAFTRELTDREIQGLDLHSD